MLMWRSTHEREMERKVREATNAHSHIRELLLQNERLHRDKDSLDKTAALYKRRAEEAQAELSTLRAIRAKQLAPLKAYNEKRRAKASPKN